MKINISILFLIIHYNYNNSKILDSYNIYNILQYFKFSDFCFQIKFILFLLCLMNNNVILISGKKVKNISKFLQISPV